MISDLLAPLLTAPGWLLVTVVGTLVFLEDALFVGFVLPAETAAVLGGVAAKLGHVQVQWILLIVIAAAVVGDSVGYEVGRHFGPRLLRTGFLERRSERIDAARDLLARRGGTAIFLGRWVAFLRAVMPALAGAALMPYRRFFAFNAIGGVLWGSAVVAIGYLAGASYESVAKGFGRGAAVAVVAVVAVGFLIWRLRGHRQETV